MVQHIKYSAIILTQESSNHLKFWWKMNIGELLNDVLCHHMTIEFKPDKFSIEYNQEFLEQFNQMFVRGYVQNDIVQCVEINEFDHISSHPHVTVAVNKSMGGAPKQSFDLLNNKENLKLINGPNLFGRFGYVLNDDSIIYDAKKLF